MAFSEEYAQALSEINELKAEIERLEAWISTQDAEIYRQADEIERLRAALREIKDGVDDPNADNYDACTYNIAKAALEGGDE